MKPSGKREEQKVEGRLPEARHPLPQKKEQPVVHQVCINPECDSQEAFVTHSGHTCVKCGAGY